MSLFGHRHFGDRKRGRDNRRLVAAVAIVLVLGFVVALKLADTPVSLSHDTKSTTSAKPLSTTSPAPRKLDRVEPTAPRIRQRPHVEATIPLPKPDLPPATTDKHLDPLVKPPKVGAFEEPTANPKDESAGDEPEIEISPTAPDAPPSAPLDASNDPRQVVPSQDELVAAKRSAIEQLGTEYVDANKSKKSEEKTTLAKKLYDRANDTTKTEENRIDRYVLLDLGRHLACDAGDIQTSLQIVDALARDFRVDAIEQKVAALVNIEGNLRDEQPLRDFVRRSQDLSDEAERDEQYNQAIRLFRGVASAARKLGDQAVRKMVRDRNKELTWLVSSLESAQKAKDVILKTPDDPRANESLGTYLCLVKDDWEKGLPMLSRSFNEDTRELAEDDLAEPKTADDCIAVADGWRVRAQWYKGRVKERLYLRAKNYYHEVQRTASEAQKIRLDSQLKTIDQILAEIRKEQQMPSSKTQGSAVPRSQDARRLMSQEAPLSRAQVRAEALRNQQIGASKNPIGNSDETVLPETLLRRKLHGRVTFNRLTKEIVLKYDWSSKRQLLDFELGAVSPTLSQRTLSLEGGESVKHIVDFREVTIACPVFIPVMQGIILRSTGGAVAKVGGANPDTMYLGDGRGELSLIVPDELRKGVQAVKLTITPTRIAFDYGSEVSPKALGKPVQGFHAGSIEIFGGESGFQFGEMTFTGTLDDAWARRFVQDE